MFPLLAAMIAVYCVLRLVEMALTGRRLEKAGEGNGLWMIYLVGAFVILILCYAILKTGDEANRLKISDTVGGPRR